MKQLSRMLLIGCFAASTIVAQTAWTDVSTAKVSTLGTQSYPGGVAGTCVNRLTGDVFINIVGFGIHKSVDQGATWTSYSGNTISGRCENGWGIQVCQDNPAKMAVFSLDGDAGYTLNGGTTWKKFTQVWGRNWDYGSVDWAGRAMTIIAMDHENSGVVRKSTDGGTTWIDLGIRLSTDVWGSGPMTIGAMDSTTFIYSNASGIQRSTNLGGSWSQVSSEKPMGKVVVLFNNKHYLGTATGLIVSSDKGLTWQHQGAALNIYQGPYFGSTESQMVVAGTAGIYQTINGGTSWTKVGDFPTVSSQGFGFNPLWFGANTWDPINAKIYATAMANPAFKKGIAATAVVASSRKAVSEPRLIISGKIIHSSVAFTRLQVFTLSGAMISDQPTQPVYSASLLLMEDAGHSPKIYRVTTTQGVLQQIF